MLQRVGQLILVSLLFACTATADILTVDKSGSGDFLYITDALAAADPLGGDIIEIMPGTYYEALVLDRSVEFVGVGGPGAVVLDGQSSWGVVTIHGAYVVSFRDMTFSNSNVTDAGGAIDMRFGPTVTIDSCVFLRNHAGFDGGGVHARHAATSVVVRNSRFEGNSAVHASGAAGVILDASMTLEDCVFINNRCDQLSGAANCDTGSFLRIERCLFAYNIGSPGAVLVRNATGILEGNTFHGNVGGLGSVDCAAANPSTTVQRNIFSGNTAGPGLMIEWYPIIHGCNLYWDNASGALGGDILGADDVEADPFYCDLPGGDFTLGVISQGNPANSACGMQIGAFPAVCAMPIEATPASFSQLKTRF